MTLKPEPFRIQVASLEALSALAEAMAQAMPGDAFVTLEGDLGAGKTTFVKALAAAAGIDPSEVISPTFGLVHLHSLPGGGPARRLLHAIWPRSAGTTPWRPPDGCWWNGLTERATRCRLTGWRLRSRSIAKPAGLSCSPPTGRFTSSWWAECGSGCKANGGHRLPQDCFAA